MAIVETSSGNLGKLTCSIEPFWWEGVRRRCIDRPVCRGRGVSHRIERLSIEEQTFVRAIPRVRLDRKCVGGVWGPFVMAMDL